MVQLHVWISHEYIGIDFGMSFYGLYFRETSLRDSDMMRW